MQKSQNQNNIHYRPLSEATLRLAGHRQSLHAEKSFLFFEALSVSMSGSLFSVQSVLIGFSVGFISVKNKTNFMLLLAFVQFGSSATASLCF